MHTGGLGKRLPVAPLCRFCAANCAFSHYGAPNSHSSWVLRLHSPLSIVELFCVVELTKLRVEALCGAC